MIGESWNNLSPEERMVCLPSFFSRGFNSFKRWWFDQMGVLSTLLLGLSKHWAQRQGEVQERVERVQGENEAGK